MPILARETDIFPDDLLTTPFPDHESRWMVAYTMARREKQLMRHLVAHEVPFYTPLVAKRNRSTNGRVRTSHLPLFSNYVFINANEEQRYAATQSNCVSQLIDVNDGEKLRRDLLQLRNLIDQGVALTVESRIEAGQLVRVRSGHFAGYEGIVLKRHSNIRLVVSVNFIQQGVSVLLEDCQLELI